MREIAYIAIVMAAYGVQEPRLGPGPKARLDAEAIYDFGETTLKAGSHSWSVNNVGDRDLEVVLVKKPSCGCTVTSLEEGKTTFVRPGQALPITLEWKGAKDGKDYHQSAVIATNDPSESEIVLVVKGRIRSPVVVIPPILNVGTFWNDQNVNMDAVVFSPDRPDLKIKKVVTSRPDRFRVTTRSLTQQERERLKIRSGHNLSVAVAPGAPLGRFAEEVWIQTDHPERPEISVRMIGNAHGPISYKPERIIINEETSPGHTLEVAMVVHDGRQTTFEVVHAPYNLGVEIKPDIVRKVPNRGYRLFLSVPAGAIISDMGSSQIVLKTDHPKAGALTIPISVSQRRRTVKSFDQP